MNRHAQALLIALGMAAIGCAGGRASLPPTRYAVEPLEEAPVEPVRTSIEDAKTPLGGETVRASYEVEEPPAAATPPAQNNPPPAAAPKAEQKPAATDTPKTDAPMSIKTDPNAPPGRPASRTAAVVGDTIITYRELKAAVCQRLQKKPHELAQMPPDQLNEIARDTLDTLIDRTLILQEGRREVKKAEQWTMFTDFVDKAWKEKELPPMLRKAGVDNEIMLRKKMEAIGESLDDQKDAWKMEQMSREILMMRVQPKVAKPNLPELQAYYEEHKQDLTFQRTARVNWREIVVPVEKPEDLPTARQKAIALRSRILQGEEFAALAKANSAGVTAAKGGVRETAPDASAIPGINQALTKLAIGQISQPIDGPTGVYLVRVDSRREAGTAPFVEVQRQIAEKIFGDRFQAAITAYLQKLRDKSSISSPLFQGTESAPTVVEKKAKVDPSAKRTSR